MLKFHSGDVYSMSFIYLFYLNYTPEFFYVDDLLNATQWLQVLYIDKVSIEMPSRAGSAIRLCDTTGVKWLIVRAHLQSQRYSACSSLGPPGTSRSWVYETTHTPAYDDLTVIALDQVPLLIILCPGGWRHQFAGLQLSSLSPWWLPDQAVSDWFPQGVPN